MNTTNQSQPTHKYLTKTVNTPACQLRLGDFIYTNDGAKEVQQLTQWDDGSMTITWKGGTTRCEPASLISIKEVI